MSTHFLKMYLCFFFFFLTGLPKLFTTYGWEGSYWSGGGILGMCFSCATVDIGKLHSSTKTGPGEVPVTCFIPTVVPCHKKAKGKPSHSSSIRLKPVEKVLLRPDCVWVFGAEGSVNAQASRQLRFYIDLRLVPRVLVKQLLIPPRTTFSPLTFLDWNKFLVAGVSCLNWTLRGLRGRERESCDVVLKLPTNHTFLTSEEVRAAASAFLRRIRNFRREAGEGELSGCGGISADPTFAQKLFILPVAVRQRVTLPRPLRMSGWWMVEVCSRIMFYKC